MLIGYMRVRQGDEDALLAQRRTLLDAGCEQLVEDLASTGRQDQPELRRTAWCMNRPVVGAETLGV